MSLQALAEQRPALAAAPQRRTVPFDYQFYVPIFDPKDERKIFVNQVITSTLTISVEAAFVAVSIGYGFVPRVQKIIYGFQSKAPVSPVNFSFGEILSSLSDSLGEGKLDFSPPGELKVADFVQPQTLGPQTEAALLQGFRINPDVTRRFLVALQDGQGLKPDELAKLFQTFEPPPERIQFLYALYDNGTGRAFQSEPLLNIAGLGISDGDRPFRHFATPILFSARSTIQLDIIPQTDFHGELYVALHGYKVLGGEGTPTGHRLAESTGRRRLRRR
ncbi:MAG TPA: hypothetical protein VNX66_16260 [Candidatus Sulfotelmatobacter sp.]|jgi:hypothetical protein|nr:hypothetical protein [Candidatus Sulfotelmatobacter sp.]